MGSQIPDTMDGMVSQNITRKNVISIVITMVTTHFLMRLNKIKTLQMAAIMEKPYI